MLQHLKEIRDEEIGERIFRTKIIAKLRDANVLIASSRKGYKIPIRVADLLDFVEQTHLVIGPMVSRLKRARDKVLLSSKGDLDLLTKPEYDYLRKLIETRKEEMNFEEELLNEAEDDGSENEYGIKKDKDKK